MNDSQLTKRIAAALVEAEGMEASLPGTPSFDVSEKAEEDIREGLTARIGKMIDGPVETLFLEHLNDMDVLDDYLDDPDSEAAGVQRESFAERMTAGSCAVLRERLPALTDRARASGGEYCSAICEMLMRLDESYDRVCDTLLGGRRFSTLTDVDADSGDVHNGGRAVCVLTTDEGRIVYKPHDIMIDMYAKGLIDRFFSGIMRAPAVLPCEGCGFAEFVENRPADTDEEARRYFYSLGGLAAVVQMLGSNDLHRSNVFALGRHPVIIDSELMLTPGRKGTEGGLARDLRNSLYFSSLMPSRSVDSEMSILFAGGGVSPSAPVVDGRVRNINDYPEEFFEGFRKTYESIMDRRPEIREYISGMNGASVRHILRDTSVYGELVKRMLEPARLRDGSARDELMEALLRGPARSGMPAPEAIAEAEADAIMSGEIPYFCMRSDECGLWSGGREVYPDFMPQSPLDNALARLDRMSPEDLRFEESLIRKAMGRVMTRSARDEEAAMAGFTFERDMLSETMNAWPDRRLGPASQSHLAGYCSGAPGIGLDALRTGYEGSDGILKKAVKSCLAEPLQYKDFLCCGNSAVTEFLLEAGTALGDSRLVRAAEARMAAVIERAERNGAYTTVNRGVSRVFSPGLMYGTAGIGYEMLRLASPGRIHSLL